MKNEKLIIKKIILNYFKKFADWDYYEDPKPYLNKVKKAKNLKRLKNELYEKVTYQKKRERYEGKNEYYDTIGYNYYGGKL